MARAAPVVAVSAGVLCPYAEQQGDRGLGQEEHPDGGGDDEGEDGAQAAGHAVQEGGPSARSTTAAARSGVTTDMTVTATTP